MATSVHSWAPSTSRRAARRGLITAASLLVVVLVVWLLSGQSLAAVAVAIGPVGAIGLLLVRERGTLPAAPAGRSVLEDWEAFKREIDRSRRHERSLALAVASLPDTTLTGGLLADTIAQARSQIRSIDLLWYDGSEFWLLMPEAHREGATTAIRRIANAAPATSSAVWRLVIFPDDALTVGTLISELGRTAPVEVGARPTVSAA